MKKNVIVAGFDMGTFSDFSNADQLVSIIESRQKFKIACLEEIAFTIIVLKKKIL